MNTPHYMLLVGLVAASTAYSAAPTKVPPVPQSTGEKTHTLFMGVDISIEKDNKFHRVRDVSRASWIINVNGQPELIRTERNSHNLRVEQSLKLTEASATLGNFKGERAYSPGNHPRMEAMRAQMDASLYATDRALAAEMELSRAVDAAAWGSQGDARNPQVGVRVTPEQAMEKLNKAMDFVTSGVADERFHQGIAEEQLKHENFDAIDVEFEVSSEKLLPNPYVIIVAQYHEKDAAPGLVRNWIYAESLDPVDATPKKIRLLRAGFPVGYILDKVEVHLYDRGREVATNLSPKRVPLTQDEAFQYLVIEHISGNKGATVGAAPVMAKLPPEIWTRLKAGQGQSVYYLKVSKDGRVAEAYEDADFSRKIADPFFANAMKNIWFKPALEKGKPVDTTTQVDVTKLRL